MSAPLHPSDRCRIRVDRVGSEAAPMIVVDDLLADAAQLVDVAAHETFAPVTHRAYPGIRAAAPPQYAGVLHQLLRDLICSTFGFTGSDVIAGESSFSIVTSAPGNLHIRQRLPHFDSPDTQLIAVLHYLCPEALGGTSFYRHRATGFESITADRLARFDETVNTELAEVDPVGYINGDSAQRTADGQHVFHVPAATGGCARQ
ncbi:MAG: DUF6445 family protein [Steroidobacteraceae bacterium]